MICRLRASTGREKSVDVLVLPSPVIVATLRLSTSSFFLDLADDPGTQAIGTLGEVSQRVGTSASVGRRKE